MIHTRPLMFRSKIYLIICVIASIAIHAQSSEISVPQQHIEWRNQKGNFYSPFDKRGAYSKAIIELSISGKLSGDFFVGFELNGTDMKRTLSHASNQELTYFLTSKTNTNQYLLDWPMVSSPENIISFSLDGKQHTIKRFPIYMWIDPGQNVSTHTFNGELVVNVYQGKYNDGGQPEKIATGKIGVTVKVSDDIQISLGNDQFNRLSEFNVSFEELKKGEVILYDVFVNSYDSYVLTFYSKGKGHLTHHIDQVKTKIPYQITLDNQPIVFDEFGTAKQTIEKDGKAEKKQHKIKLILGSATHAFKGEYSDRLTLRASPKN